MKKYRIRLGNMYLKAFSYNYGRYSDCARYIEFAEDEYYIFNELEDTFMIEGLINFILDVHVVVEEFTIDNEGDNNGK
jgi:hypothetical protein